VLVQQQLEKAPEGKRIEQADLNQAVAAASHATRSTIFRLARDVRRAAWRNPADRDVIELTIPVFRALISADPNYHRDHGQLAYALKDQSNPDYAAAKQELNEAMRLRGPWKENGYEVYEMNRAECTIRMETAEGRLNNSPDPIKNEIRSDLEVANAGGLGDTIKTEVVFTDWIQANPVQ
jgi:hypothetical protein